MFSSDDERDTKRAKRVWEDLQELQGTTIIGIGMLIFNQICENEGSIVRDAWVEAVKAAIHGDMKSAARKTVQAGGIMLDMRKGAKGGV